MRLGGVARDFSGRISRAYDVGPISELRANLQTYRRLRWLVRTLVAFCCLGAFSIDLTDAISIRSSAVQYLIVPPIIYLIIEFLLLVPEWLTRPHVHILLSFGIGLSAGIIGYEQMVPSTEFYKAAAALVPALFLALVVERRREYQATQRVGARVITILNVLLLLLAGKACFDVLAYDDARRGNTLLITVPVVFAVVSLLLAMITPSAPSNGGAGERPPVPEL